MDNENENENENENDNDKIVEGNTSYFKKNKPSKKKITLKTF
jgi:hypothetical protein